MTTAEITWDITDRPPLTPGQIAIRRFRRHKMANAGLILLLGVFLFVIVGSFSFSEAESNFITLESRLSPPSLEHPFGTDNVGRDILARTIYGGQISIIIGLLAVVISIVVGVLIGAISGYYGGFIDSILMRFTEAMFNIPSLFLLIILGKMLAGKVPTFILMGRTFSGSVIVIIGVIGLTSWMYLARIVRSNILSLKEQEFVTCVGNPSGGRRDYC